MRTSSRVAVIGAGFGGLGLGHALGQAGIDDYVIFEKGDHVGGVWRDNTYPGAACDVPSHLYSFSFESKLDWSRKYAPQREILDYLQHVANKYDISRRIRLNSEVTSARFDARRAIWNLTMGDGSMHEAHIVVSAVGQLSRPRVPTIPGLDTFTGKAFHSACWDHSVDLRQRRAAVIGTGSSAIQIVPAIQPKVAKLSLFQRSAAYVVARNDRAYSERELALLSRLPLLHTLSRGFLYGSIELRMLAFLYPDLLMPAMQKQFAERLVEQIPNPRLRAKLTPDYPAGCKRLLLSDDYYPALCQPNAEVITAAISRIDGNAIITDDGARHEVDAIIFGTGFRATEFLAPIDVIGAGGLSINEAWKDGAEAYLGLCVSGFPNFFMLYGPNTNLGHSSVVFMIENQVRFVMEALALMEREKLARLEVRKEVQDSFNHKLQTRLSKLVWAGNCTNWYKTENGKNTNNWPGYTFAYRLATRRLRRADFELTRQNAAQASTVPSRFPRPLRDLN